ncbi:MAG: MoxR family ATPase, partial [Bauldia litoralis]
MSAPTQPQVAIDPDKILAETEAAVAKIRSAREAIGKVIYGQETVVDRTLITILAGGHGLLIGVPGLAKTKLVETLGTVFGLNAARVQFTPDLMPSDILGSEVMDVGAVAVRALRFKP